MAKRLPSHASYAGSKPVRAVDRSRRLFLGSGLAAGAIVLFGGASWLFRSNDDLVVSVVRRHLPDTNLSESLIRTFAADFFAYNRQIRKYLMALHGLRIVGPIVFSPSFQSVIPGRQAQLLAEFEREIVTRFLFSTDFFERGARGWEGVTYNGFYDPYLRPCSNPLARFDSSISMNLL